MIYLLTITLQDCIEPGQNTNCSNHGTCINQNGTERCQCQTGYAGMYCQKCKFGFDKIDNSTECYSRKCIQNGTLCTDTTYCAQTNNNYSCVCKIGYTGDDCSACSENYTMISKKCIDNNLIVNNQQCSGHGQVINNNTEQFCNCTAPYQGNTCNECMDGFVLSQDGLYRCVNVKNCIDANNRECGGHGYCEKNRTEQYACQCINHFTGTMCNKCPNKYGFANVTSDPSVHPLKDKCIPTTCFNQSEYNQSSHVYQNVSECNDYGYCFNFLRNNIFIDGVINKIIDKINQEFGLSLKPNGCVCKQQHMNSLCNACANGYIQHTNDNKTTLEATFYDHNLPFRDPSFTCKKNRCDNNCNGNGECAYDAIYDEYRCTCKPNYNSRDGCNSCINQFTIESNCTKCKDGYDINVLCAHCELGRNESTGCTECLENYMLQDGTCGQCEHNMDINKRCQECPDNMYPDVYGDCSSLTKSSSTVGIVIGVIIGICAFIAVIIVSVILVRRKRAKKFTEVEVTPLIR